MSIFSGVCAAAITPHREGGHEADFGVMLELLDHLCNGGVDGICLLGSTGEFLNLSSADRIRLVHLGVKRSRVPVMAGVSHSTLDGAVELSNEAIGSGAAALLVMPPYFFRYDQQDIAEFYLRFSENVPRRVPVFLYNIPLFTSAISIETARALLSTGRFVGIKDSSGDAEYMAQLIALKHEIDFTLLCGNDRLLVRARTAGADGVVSGCACAVPELVAALDRSIAAGDSARADTLEAQLGEFIAWIERFPTPVGVKVASGLRGIKTGPLAVPLDAKKAAMLEEFKSWFRGWVKTLPKADATKRKR